MKTTSGKDRKPKKSTKPVRKRAPSRIVDVIDENVPEPIEEQDEHEIDEEQTGKPAGAAKPADAADEDGETDEQIINRAREALKICRDHYDPEYAQSREDNDFLYGDPWPEKIRQDREEKGRPCLNIPRLAPFVHQVENEIRQSRPAIKVGPVDDKADKATAAVLKGAIRNIETMSGADNIYDTAASNAIRGGYGWIRVNPRYADERSLDQELEILDVFNPFSVMIDPSHTKKDGSDAEFGFVLDMMPRAAFEAQYPEAQAVSFEDYADLQWCDQDSILVAEFYWKRWKKTTIYQVINADGAKVIVTREEAADQGIDVSAVPKALQRETRIPTVKWVKLTAAQVLERTDVPGKYIPIVPVFGDLIFHEGKRKSRSLIYDAKDAQRLFNYWKSAHAEMVALQPKAPFVGPTGAFKTHRKKWSRANVDNLPFLEYDPVFVIDPSTKQSVLAPAPVRQMPPQGSAAMFQETMAASDDIKAAMGMFAPSLGEQGDEKSGKAILARQQQGNNATFHFIDNLATAIRHVGRIIVDMFPHVYSGERMVRILGDTEDQEQTVPLNTPLTDAAGNPMIGHNGGPAMFAPDVGKYDVTVSVGPAYATKRIESVNTLIELIRANPAIAPQVADILFKNLDFAEADTIAERMKALLPPELQGNDPAAMKLAKAEQVIKALTENITQLQAKLESKEGREEREFALKDRELTIKENEAEVKLIAALQPKPATGIPAAADGAAQAAMPPGFMEALVTAIEEIQANQMDTGTAVAGLIELLAGETTEIPSGDEGTPAPVQAGA